MYHKLNIITTTKKKAFTMMEILIITVVIGVWLISIIAAVSKAKTSINNIKQSVIATQLAKEWIEMVYQIRNTNLLKHKSYKNYCRLDVNPTESCDDSTHPNRMTENSYILSWQALSWISQALNIQDGITTWDKLFWLCLTWWQRTNCPRSNNKSKYWSFFRTIEGKWLFLKNSLLTWGESIDCSNWNTQTYCNENTAKEFRFCSRVEYIWTKPWNVEICGALTNFF